MIKEVNIPFTVGIDDKDSRYCGSDCPHWTLPTLQVGWCRYFRTQLEVDSSSNHCGECKTELKKEAKVFRCTVCREATREKNK